MSAIVVLPNRIDDEMRTRDSERTDRGDTVAAHTVIRVEGELDALMLPEFRQVLGQAIHAGPPVVVIDLRRTRFLSLGNALVLMCAADDATRAGIELRIVAGPREIDRVLTLTGVSYLVQIYPSLRSALDEADCLPARGDRDG